MKKLDGFDEAILGVSLVNDDICMVYDAYKIQSILINRDGMDEDAAIDHMTQNIETIKGPLLVWIGDEVYFDHDD